jgi:NADH-quinone oxidoreductase subunit M
MATLSIIYASLTTIRQIDLKRIIAYSSVAHMNLVVLGIFSFNIQGLSGSILLMVAHGIVSGGLFLMLGFLYVRYHTRLLYYYGGIAMTMPLFATFFLLFSLSNLGMPGTSNFIGETLILMGIFQTNTFIALLACSGMVFSATYSLWLYNRVSFGTLKLQYIKYYTDINRQEFYLLLPLACINLIIGIYPNFILNLCYPSLKYLLLFLYKS